MYVDPNRNRNASNLCWLMPYCRPELPRVIGAQILYLVSAAMALVTPLIAARIVDRVIEQRQLSLLTGLCLALIGVTIVRDGAYYGNQMWMERAGQNTVYRLVSDEYEKLHTLDFDYFNHTRTGDIMSRMTSDTDAIRHLLSWVSYQMLNCVVMFVGALAFMTSIDWRLALALACVTPFLFIFTHQFSTKAKPLFLAIRNSLASMNSMVEENIEGNRVVKAFVREDYESKKFGRAAEDVCADFTRAERILALNGPLMQFCIYSVMVFVLSFGSYTIISSMGIDLDVGQLSALLTYSFMMLMSLMMLSMVFVMITMAGESTKRILEVLSEKSTLTDPENPVYEVPDGSVDFDGVSFRYSAKAERMALSNIDLHIKSGETIGIIGGTGSAKSTLVNLISRLYDVTEGSVKVGGRDVREYDIEALRSNVAVVLQKNQLFSGTIKENLRWGNKDATDEELVHVCKLAQADDFIRSFPDGYDTYIEQGGTNVSGGQKQRLCIARALLKKPKILILDDSTSAVDTKTDAGIRRALREFMPETTKIIIAQRTASVEDADRIVVMDGGSIMAVGSHAELMASNEVYREIYTSQNKAGADE